MRNATPAPEPTPSTPLMLHTLARAIRRDVCDAGRRTGPLFLDVDPLCGPAPARRTYRRQPSTGTGLWASRLTAAARDLRHRPC